MEPILGAALVLVHAALGCYTIGIVLEQRSHRASRAVVAWLVAGVVLDVSATVGMILVSDRMITLHGVVGYSALAAMSIDTVRVARHRRLHGDAEVPRALHLFSRFAYLWWVVAYFTGAALAMASRRGG